MSTKRVAGFVLAWWLVGCGPSLGDAYERSFAAGQRAHHAGRYEEAAESYDEAARVAERVKDRDEALFLVARMHERRGAHVEAKAALQKLAETSPDGPRAGRAAFELADLEITHGDAERGYGMLFDATARHTKHGLARRAVKRIVEHERERGGDEAVLAWAKGPARILRNTDLEENVDYEAALALERLGRLAEARDALVALSVAHPYPYGTLTDDALWHASLIEEKLGRYEAAITHLRTLLAARESSHLTGSYERPRYSPAQMRIAALYRDRLHDHRAARREMHKLYADHPTSDLRDDALWAEARLAHEDGDKDEACDLVTRLRKDFSDSRYARCAHLVCDEMRPAPNEKPCAGYIEQEVSGRKDEDPADPAAD
ncbi:tetratricopeptide repeat protein [Polyangium sorediatum]|uniref:Tetratricopeptide repeat protein n=1 Tax=Polyangium sorediatum TaxID=889274 RepID=A0ABT6NNJ1_9BACT|nr:tetratricopeptide repeat protein [Polyangium sorediatum]MDI1429897.1 tetratricopeptide repeat protein [Polyangium sorediatum]